MTQEEKLLGFISIGMKAGAYTLGANLTQAASKSGSLKLILLSSDASDNTKKLVNNISLSKKIKTQQLLTSEKLGAACGKQKLSVIGIKNEKIALRILDLYKEIEETVKGGDALCQK